MVFTPSQRSFKTKDIIHNWHTYHDSCGNQWVTWVRNYILYLILKISVILMACVYVQLMYFIRSHSRINADKESIRLVSLKPGQQVSNPFFEGTLFLLSLW